MNSRVSDEAAYSSWRKIIDSLEFVIQALWPAGLPIIAFDPWSTFLHLTIVIPVHVRNILRLDTTTYKSELD